ncbi:hypothetical protein F511_41434 [Dorcoceras hygrometricum]|uniref:Uncharacterized protein n=1 Tax=Dorcoceras hygrometricum TaxID=472368 RepID=A0A2Z7BWK0_9LAMI|nr:hypothetical protein F511_41434 [Dorcoceras hygrometricum]
MTQPILPDRNEENHNSGNKPVQSYSRQSATNTAYTLNQGSNPRFKEGKIYSHQEYLNRKEKGLCYRCGEPCNPSHRCNNKSLRVAFLVDDDDEEPVELLEQEICAQGSDGDAISHECNALELSIYSIGGITQPQTMKLRGRVMGKEIVVMMDSGASRNFVS